MRIVTLHELVPTTGQFEEHEISVNFDNVSYFHPTLDGKYTMIMFDKDNRLQVKEDYRTILKALW